MSTTVTPSDSPPKAPIVPPAAPLAAELPGVTPLLPDANVAPGAAPRQAWQVGLEEAHGAPLLPDVEGPKATPQQLASLFGGDINDLPVNARCMAYMALLILQDGALQQVITHERLRRTYEARKNSLKAAQLRATMDKIVGDRWRSFNMFCASLGGVAASAIPGYIGNLMCITTDGVEIAKGQALVGISHSLGQLVQSAVTVWDKLAWGGRMADDADVLSRALQRDEDIMQQVTDAARSLVENARQQWQKAQQSLSEMNERRVQAISMVHR